MIDIFSWAGHVEFDFRGDAWDTSGRRCFTIVDDEQKDLLDYSMTCVIPKQFAYRFSTNDPIVAAAIRLYKLKKFNGELLLKGNTTLDFFETLNARK